MTVADSTARVAARLTVTGRVQGVGFRPAVARLARDLDLGGWVGNTPQGVTIVVEGDAVAVQQFQRQLPGSLSRLARIAGLETCRVAPTGQHQFAIRCGDESSPNQTNPLTADVPPDVRICAACTAELSRPDDRRHGYAWTSCAECGPRYSILNSMPYERPSTTMVRFTQCPACLAEYTAPLDRRLHAQTNACVHCGPRLWAAQRDAAPIAVDRAAVDAADRVLRQGGIVAALGLGGYQLLVDATSATAVARLRQVKQRPAKPLAVLVGSLDAARACGRLSPLAAQALADAAGPIVVVPQRDDSPVVPNVAGDLGTVGLMLPTTGLHVLLTERLGPLVATSGNIEGDPLVVTPTAAHDELGSLADLWLHHDRPIARPVDDSVVGEMAGQMVALRAARGLTPLRLPIEQLVGIERCPPVLATGGHQKCALAVWNGGQAILGPHIGDLDSLATRSRFAEQAHDLPRLFQCDPAIVACDEHPDYASTRWARETAGHATAVVSVQHHHAHIVSAMLEHGRLDQSVLGLAWDGTGWGPDGTVWGGELLCCTAASYERLGRLRPLRLPGGVSAIRQPWRTAAWLLAQCHADAPALADRWLGPDRTRQLAAYGRQPWPGLWTSSMGRLFDAVAVLVLGDELLPELESPYEGFAAMRLESLAWHDPTDDGTPAYPLPLTTGAIGQCGPPVPRRSGDAPTRPDTLLEWDWRPLIAALVNDRLRGATPASMARRFHTAVTQAALDAAALFPTLPVVVGGGVFQNRWLVERLQREFATRGRAIALPGRVPPNDGGLAAGQLVVAIARWGDG